MADMEKRVRDIVQNIAKEQKYENYTTEVHPVNSGGANYTSRLFVAKVSAPKQQDIKLFIKAAVMGENLRALTDTPIFEVETTFYTKVLPKYSDLEERFNVPADERLIFPKYYGGTTEYLHEMIVLEDLTELGYHPFDRMQCYDWEFASECVSLLARLHALSIAYEKDDPDGYTEICKSLFKFNFIFEPSIRDFNEKCMKAALRVTEEKYKSRVEKCFRHQTEAKNILKYYQPERTVVLHHGDFRPSNILQKFDEHGNRSLVLIDHQLVERGNPLRDLLYFLVSGSDEEFRAKHLDQYFDHYYEELKTALARFQISVEEVYRKQDYEEDVKELLPFGLALAAFTLPIITVDAAEAPGPDVQIDFQDLEMEVSELFAVRFNGLVRDYVRLGILCPRRHYSPWYYTVTGVTELSDADDG